MWYYDKTVIKLILFPTLKPLEAKIDRHSEMFDYKNKWLVHNKPRWLLKLPCFSNLLDPTSPTDEQRSTSDKSDNKRKEITKHVEESKKTWKRKKRKSKTIRI